MDELHEQRSVVSRTVLDESDWKTGLSKAACAMAARNVEWRAQGKSSGYSAIICRVLCGTRWRLSRLHSDTRRSVGVSPYTWEQAAISAMAPHSFSSNGRIQNIKRQRGKSWQLSFRTGKGLFLSISCLE
jgi:hypothetical protein